MIDLTKVFDEKEHINIEVKAAQGGIPESVWETYSSFANSFGGTIILGIGEDKETKKFIPYGVSNPDKMLSDIWNTVNNRQKISGNILVERNVYVQKYEGKDYVIIEVPRANRQNKPVYVGTDMFSGSYRRNHEGDYHCTKQEVRTMVRDSLDSSADSLVLDNVGLDALDTESIKSYRTRFELIRNGHIWNKLPTNEFLTKIGAAKISEVDGKIHPTLGGLVFFGDYINIIDELPDYFLDYREKMSTDTRWSDRVCSSDGDWSGNVFDFYFRIMDRITADVKRPFKLDENLLRVDDTPVHKGLRECLANALIHADYYGRRGIVIEKEFRKVTISNPGTFRVDINEAISGGVSDVRNAKIFNMFSLINIGERSGTGLCDVFETWKHNGYKQPQITEMIEPDRVTIILDIEVDADRGKNEINETNCDTNATNRETNCDTNETNRETNCDTNETNSVGDLNESEQLIFNAIKANPELSIVKLSKEFAVSKATINRIMKKLKEKGFIERMGTTRGKWKILK